MDVRWIDPKDYNQWGQSRGLSWDEVGWVGVVCRTPGDRSVTIRALQRGSSFLIKVCELVEDRMWEAGNLRYKYSGQPYITLSATGTVEFRNEFSNFQYACELALKKYVTEFMKIEDLEKIRKRIMT